MKTLDEIRQALSHCNVDEYSDDMEDCCQECPYFLDTPGDSCLTDLHMDAALMMTTLEDQNRALTTELTTNRKPDTKADDQEAKADRGKPRLTLVPPRIIWDIAAVREYGTAKYHDPENWRTVEPDRLWAACTRHIVAAWNDYRATDDDSGLLHLAHAATNLAFLLQMIGEDEPCQNE